MSQTSIKKPVVLIGMGEIGGVFSRGLLRIGHPVYPLNRDGDIDELSQQVSNPEMVIVAVGEKDLQSILEKIPSAWREKLVLLQNELLPNDWLAHKLNNPTVISIWFEKKPGKDAKVIIPSPVFGPHAEQVKNALTSINIACRILNEREELLFELVLKNLYILTTNICGLVVGSNVGSLWEQQQALATQVAEEIIQIQEVMTGESFDHAELINGMCEAFSGDLKHGCMGRSAPARLSRTMLHVEQYQLTTPMLQEIAQKTN